MMTAFNLRTQDPLPYCLHVAYLKQELRLLVPIPLGPSTSDGAFEAPPPICFPHLSQAATRGQRRKDMPTAGSQNEKQDEAPGQI